MKAVIQRVSNARVEVESRVVGKIGNGLVVLLGVMKGDQSSDVAFMARKIAQMRIFIDDNRKMNLSVCDVQGKILLISQFTLAAPTASGNRPSFSAAMPPESAEPMIDLLKQTIESEYGLDVQTGKFGAEMQVQLNNDGPVTVILDSRRNQTSS